MGSQRRGSGFSVARAKQVLALQAKPVPMHHDESRRRRWWLFRDSSTGKTMAS
jgi:hypothetical protein